MTGPRHDADAVIVGAGVAGGLMACALASAGLKVLLLEGGPDVSRSDLRARFLQRRSYSPVTLDPTSDFAPTTDPDDADAYLINEGAERYNLLMTKAVGGTTWHWTARCFRFGDSEFRLKSTYGVGVDWPIAYADIEPYYVRAEHEMGVSAPSTGPEAERRSVPAPMADFEWPYIYKHLQDVLRPHGYRVGTGAYARNNREYDGRPACRGNNTCWPLCPIGAQYSAIVHIDKARALNVEVRPESLVTRLKTDDTRRITSAVYRRPDGSHGQVTAKVFVLAANGLETPKLLLASAGEKVPAGVANSSGQVGRNFMDHATVSSDLVARDPVYPGRGPIAFGSLEAVSDGDYRRHRAATGYALDNRMNVDVIAGEILREGYVGDALDAELRFRAMRKFSIFSSVEVLPDPQSRILLDWQRRDSAGQPRMRINFNIDDYTRRGMDHAAHVHGQLAERIGVVTIETLIGTYFGHHPAGAVRMGSDPRESVVDARCRSHDHSNLYIAGSAVFPTCGGVSAPTLTIAALALRTADAIAAGIGKL